MNDVVVASLINRDNRVRLCGGGSNRDLIRILSLVRTQLRHPEPNRTEPKCATNVDIFDLSYYLESHRRKEKMLL